MKESNLKNYEILIVDDEIEYQKVVSMILEDAGFMTASCSNGAEALEYLKENEIAATFHYIPLHTAPAGVKYGEFRGEDKYTTAESERLLRLPMYYGLEEEKVDYIADKVKAFYNGK